ncbi:MAG: GNAT family N-acetyltransferase [Pseudomonadales bacterium]
MAIRGAVIDDAAAIAAIFHDAIHELAAEDYGPELREAWAGANDPDRWRARIEAAHAAGAARRFWVAEREDEVAGFCEFDADGHVDTLYVSPRFAARGVASELLDQVERKARELGLRRIYTEASITARPMFEHRGFVVTAPQQVPYRGAVLRNYRMEKRLTDG